MNVHRHVVQNLKTTPESYQFCSAWPEKRAGARRVGGSFAGQFTGAKTVKLAKL
jgi:hypothetical protein